MLSRIKSIFVLQDFRFNELIYRSEQIPTPLHIYLQVCELLLPCALIVHLDTLNVCLSDPFEELAVECFFRSVLDLVFQTVAQYTVELLNVVLDI